MSYCCPQCSFTAQFESALLMHRQLHHESPDGDPDFDAPKFLQKSNTLPRVSPPRSPFVRNKEFRLAERTSSATRLFDKLKAKICRSKTMFSHPEERTNTFDSSDLSVPSECTSKAPKLESIVSRGSALTTCLEDTTKDSYGCHLCPFDADRITVLDRHLLNHHKVGLENLLQLVMAKTKDGLSENTINTLGIRQPYYKLHDDIIEEGEFIIETVAPKIKILKHASTNTENINMFPNFPRFNETNIEEDSFQMIAKEAMMESKDIKVDGSQDVMAKMATLNECMCKFVDSSNTLKKVLNKELDSKVYVGHLSENEPIFNLGLGDRETPKDYERAHSEKMDRRRNYTENMRSEKVKPSAESFNY